MGSIQPINAPEAHHDALERDAYNAAFRELGLRWHWDAATFRALKAIPGDEQRVRSYVERHEPHLLKAYDAAFLIEAVLAAKEQARPQVADLVSARATRCADCAEYATGQTGF